MLRLVVLLAAYGVVMHVEVNEKGIVTVTYAKPNPELVRELIESVKAKYGIKNLVEMSKLFGLSPASGKRAVVGWCASKDKPTSLPIPQAQFELLLLLANDRISINSVSNVAKPPKNISKELVIKTVCERFDIKLEYIGLKKDWGEYCWIGDLAILFPNPRTGVETLNEITLDGWVELFEHALYRADLLGKNINEAVESSTWKAIDYMMTGGLEVAKKQFSLKKPCKDCPFRNDEHAFKGLHPNRAKSIIDSLITGETGTFPCHKTIEHSDEYDESGEEIEVNVMQRKHCAGAMAVALKADAMPLIMFAGLSYGLVSKEHYDGAKELSVNYEDL